MIRGVTPLPGALVEGWSAFVVDVLLTRYLDRYLAAMSPAQRAELALTKAAVHAAAKLHQERGSTAGGSAEAPVAEIDGCSDAWVGTGDAAPFVGASERRVRQLAARWEHEGLARKVGRSWLIDPQALVMYRRGRHEVA